MKLNLPASGCDAERLEALLCGRLSDAEQREAIAHLNDCGSCRQRLQAQAAEPEAWSEAESLLRPCEFAAPAAGEARRPPAIQHVLDELGATDDPQMLGRLGGYEVSGVVGAGGMGVVLKALDKSLDRTVAIKVLAPHLATSGAARRRFAREAKAAAAVLHPNVIAIHSVSNDESLPYLVMPYLRGQSLQKRLDAEGPLPVQEVLRIGAQIAAGLAAAHAQGLVHRDIKPANILLEEGVERVTITDFGLARASDDASITHSGLIAGTPQFMSPEQARGDAVDQRSDLFSLGSVLYAACTGRPPFRAETSYGVLRRITDDEPTPIRDINPDIPDWLCTVASRLMSKRPQERFESAQEVANLLEQCLAHVQQPTAVPLPQRLVSRPPSANSATPLATTFRYGVLAMIAALGLGLLAAFVWLAADPPEISGQWSGDEWGQVVLKKLESGAYEGTYTDTFGKEAGQLELKWSAVERRFKGAWREGQDRSGKLAVRLVDGEIRGAWTADKESRIGPGTPELADLLWKRSSGISTTLPPAAVAGKASAEPRERSTIMPGRLNYFTTGHSIKVACSADGKLIAVANGNPTRILQVGGISRVKGDWKPTADILDLETGKVVVSLQLATSEEQAVLAATERNAHLEATALAFSPTGKIVAVGTSIGQVKFFDARTGELLRSLDHAAAKLADKETPDSWRSIARAMGSVTSLAFSPDGSLLAVCGQPFRQFSDAFDGVSRLGREITGPDRLKVWEVETGKLKHDLVGHTYPDEVAFSTDGTLLASAGRWSSEGDDGSGVIFWNPHSGEKVGTLKADANVITQAVAFSPGGKLVAVGSQTYSSATNDDNTTTISLASAPTGLVHWKHTVAGWANPKAFSPHGVVVLCKKSILLLDAETGQVKREIKATDLSKEGRWDDLAVAGRWLVIASADEYEGNVELQELAGPEAAAARPAPQPKAEGAVLRQVRRFQTAGSIQSVAVSPDGKRIAVAGGEESAPPNFDWKRQVEILDADTGQSVVKIRLSTKEEDAVLAATAGSYHFEVLAFSPDGSVLAVGTSAGQVKLFNPRTGELVRSLDDEPAKRADKETPEKYKSLARALGSVNSLAFSPDGSLLAVCGSSFEDKPIVDDRLERTRLSVAGPGRLKVWDVKTGTLKHDLAGHDEHANAVAFSADGSLLASAGRGIGASGHESGVIVWDVASGKPRSTILIPANGGTYAVAFSPTKKLLAIGSRNFDKENDTRRATVSVAYALSGVMEWQQTFSVYANPKAFLPDGKSVAVMCGREAIRFFDAESGTVKYEIKAAHAVRPAGWNDFAVAPQGRLLVIGGEDRDHKGIVEIWDLPAPAADPPARADSPGGLSPR